MHLYQKHCREHLDAIGRPDVPAELMEASMRLQFGTLDHLSLSDFAAEAHLAAGMWDEDRATCVRMAEEYGYEAQP